jgi:hypothetical protein
MIASHKHIPSPTPARTTAKSSNGDRRLAKLDEDQFYAWRFPVQHEIDKLRRQLALLRDESAEFERRGFPSLVLSDLKSDAVRLSHKIESLTASLASLL